MSYSSPLQLISELKIKISYVSSDTHLQESLEMTLDKSLLRMGENTLEITDNYVKDKLNNADPTLNIKPTLITKYSNNLVTTTDGNIFNNLITPVITFPTEFVTSLTYGSNYIFYTATISNNSPLQSITYSIINSSTFNTTVASIISGANTTHPVIQINSSGTFQIQAKCSESSDGYKGVTKVSSLITIAKQYPIINFLPNNFPLLINYNADPILFYISAPLATLSYNTGQTITYSIVDIDGVTPSNIATISFDGSYIVKNSVGSFRILASVSSNINYDLLNVPSEIITIQKSTPTITKFPTISSSFAYGNVFTIPSDIPYAITTSNTDTQEPAISYSSSDSAVATISEGMTITIIGLGEFQITVTIGATHNYKEATYTLPLTYTSVKATPVILQYPQINLIAPVTSSTLVYGQTYTVNPLVSQISTITSNTDTSPSPNINYTSSDETVSTISGSNVTIVGIGYFQILTTVGSTMNYNQILRSPSPSPQIYYAIQATPSINSNSFPKEALLEQTWVYGQTYSGIIPIANNISTTNTDGPVISYSTSDSTIATISGNTITIIGVGNFQILVLISNTTHYSTITYNYPTINTYYTSIQATPIITFPSNFTTSSIYGSTYNFVPALISNNDPSQTIQYSIYLTDSTVATIIYNPASINPSVLINSVGTFQIKASCLASSSGYYSAAPNTLSPVITISKENPNIIFNTNIFSNEYNFHPTYTYTFSESYPIASITNNTGQTLTYSIVDIDSITPSIKATISSNGTSLITNSVGSFRILASTNSIDNYNLASKASEIITVISSIPVVTNFPIIPSSFIFGDIFTIPSTITTTNSDTQDVNFSYSSSNVTIATISDMTITIVGVGGFQISVTIGATANYNSATYVYPTPTTYYSAIQATPTITFPSNFGSTWVVGGTYNLTSSVTSNAGSGYTDTNMASYIIINPSVSNIATILVSGSQVTINDAGTFQIQAYLNETNFIAAASVQSNTISVNLSNVSLLPNIFPSFVYGGGPYTLPTNPTNNTDTNPPPTITYQIFPHSGSTGNGTISGNSLTITAAGGAYIYVNITATENFNVASIPVYVNIAQATPNIVMNTGWINSQIYALTIGSVFGAYALISSNSNTDTGLTYSLSSTIANGIGTVSIQNNKVFCNAPGIFSLQVTSNATANFSATTVTTQSMYVSVVPEVIIYNNPKTWPPYGGLSGEVGMAICLPGDDYPYGFNNYSQLVITNVSQNGATFTLNANTTPTFNSVINKYMVFFEIPTSSDFSLSLSTSTASNIAYTGQQNIASGMSSGQNLTFVFTGNTVGQGFPDPLTISWDLANRLELSQGQVFGSFYSYMNNITPSKNLPSGTGVNFYSLNIPGITGYFTAPWAGYKKFGNGTTSGIPALNTLGFTTIQQAWGVWVNINSGDQFGNTITFDNGVTYCYVGIPQIVNPITYNP